MTSAELDALVEKCIQGAMRLVKRGWPVEKAVEVAAAVAVEAIERRGGLGQAEVLKRAAEYEPVKAAREAISPWLWVVSIVGFALGLLNTKRIAKMFGEWKGKRARA